MHCLIIKGNLHFVLTILLLLLSLLLFLLEYPARPRYKREYLCQHLVGLAGSQWNPTGGEYGHQLKGTCHGVRVIRVFVLSGPLRAKKKRLGQMFCRCKD